MRLTALLLLALAAVSTAHMELLSPPGIRSKNNKFTTDPNFDMKSPLSSGGADWPCKGYLSLLNTPQGQSVASWPAGSKQTWTLEGNTRHNGGSCQASISTDGGSTFKVVHSYHGGCPMKDSWDFKVPGDTPAGPAVFSFSWLNQIGNRELYMNCASVTITGGGGRESVAFNSRPNIFRANTGNGCTTVEGRDTVYPDPGPDVTVTDTGKFGPPVGNCGPSGPQGGSGGSVSTGSGDMGGGPGADSPAGGGLGGSPSDPGNGGMGGTGGGSTGPGSQVDPIPGLIPSVNGRCGQQYTCINSLLGSCCSAQGRCGTSDADCGAGCQGLYGRCMDSLGNPNTYTGRRGSAGKLETPSFWKWMMVGIAVGALWRML